MSTTPERESRTLHQKKPQIDRIHEGYPPKNSGYEGEIRLHFVKGDGLRLYVRRAKNWHYTSLSTTGTTSTTTTVSSGGSGDITSVTAGTGLSGGGTTGDVTLTNSGVTSNVAGTGINVNASTGAVTITNAGVTSNVAGTGINVSAATGAVTISVSGLTVSELAANSLQTSGESFSDNDTSLMTSAAIQDKIQSFSYITLSSLSASAPITYDNSSGAFSIADHAVTLAKLPEIATARFLGRTSSSTGDVEVLTVGQVGTLLSLDTYLTAPRTVTAGGNTLATSETLAFTAGSNVTITESGGAVTITSTDTNTDTVDMGDGFRLVDVDSNVQVTENKYVKFKTASGGSGFGDITGGDGSSGNPWIYQLQYTDTNTVYSVMGNGNSYAAGLVLAGASNHLNQYLRKDGTWDLPSIHIQDDDGNSLTVDIDEHIKITGTGGITTDWTTDDAGSGSGTPNILTIGLGSITQVGALSQGSIASGFTTIDEGFIDSDIVRKNANTTITGIYTFSGKGIVINAGSGDNVTGYDASLYITATSSNDWGMWINKASYNYGLKVETAADANSAIVVKSSSSNTFIVSGAGAVTTGTWNGAVIASAYLDSDTAHLSGSIFTGTASFGDLDIIPTSSNRSVIKHDSGSGSLTLRGDQINLQNRAGDDTGLTYNDGGGVTFGGEITIPSYLNIDQTAQNGIRIKTDDTAVIWVYDKTSDALTGGVNWGHSDGTTIFYTNGINERMRITSAGVIIGSNHTLSSESVAHFQIKGSNSAAVGVKLSANGNLRGWIYANDSSEYGFLNTSGNWDLRKTHNSHLLVYGSGSTVAKFGSGDAWGRIEFEGGFTNGVYVYTQHGDFRVDGGHWNPYGNNDTDLGGDSLRWRDLKLGNHIIGGFGARETGGTTNWNDGTNARSGQGHTLLLGNHSNGPSGTGDYFHPFTFEYNSKDGGGNMTQFAIPYIVGNGGGMYMRGRYNGGWGGWVQFHDNDNMSGIARTGNSYGSFNVTNGNLGYPGHTYSSHSSKPTVMFADATGSGGIYYQTSGRWAVYHNYGHNCLGINTSSTDSAYELKVDGDIFATGDVIAFSDARWKTEIETISNPIDKIMDMRGVYYRELPKGDKKVSDRRKMGVIAQEMLKVAPEVVTYGETNDEYAVDYSKLVGILIEGIKELKQEINELKGS